MKLSPLCPSCQRKLAPIEATDSPTGATRVYDRTCRVCRETWRVVARPPRFAGELQLNVIDLGFTGHHDA